MLIDSHCHLNYKEICDNLEFYLQEMEKSQVSHALCVGTRPDNLDIVVNIASRYPNLFASVGIHPDEKLDNFKLTHEFFLKYLSNPKVIAIGETGLDYYHTEYDNRAYQHERFILHIEAARHNKLPLIIHTRESIADTLQIMREYNASEVGAVMHCFNENVEWAKKCLDLGFYISISGIVTFKNAKSTQEMAKYVPLDKLLIETDTPFLAPTPFRGKTNHPALVRYTAEYLSSLRGISLETLAMNTTNNFFSLFSKAKHFSSI